MYQGSNKTAISSQQNIAASFIKLLSEKDYSKISISEICSLAGISRQTFYSLFESKENIIAFELSKNYTFDPSTKCQCSGVPTLEQLCKGYADYIIEKKDFITLLVNNNIIYLMQDCLFDCLAKCAFSASPVTADFVAAGLTAIAKHYCLGDSNLQNTSELQTVIINLFSGKFI